jgi:hypothetical protein
MLSARAVGGNWRLSVEDATVRPAWRSVVERRPLALLVDALRTSIAWFDATEAGAQLRSTERVE